MRILFFTSLVFTLALAVKAQSLSNDSLTSVSLDSVINHIHPDKTKLIYTKIGGLIIDSTQFKKAAYTADKKNIKITFTDYTNITVKANDFWGLITDFGQCQRFYKGKTYIVWHTQAPYIYRDYEASERKINYFYSKTLLSEIIPLTEETVHAITDTSSQKQLSAYLETHSIEKSIDGGITAPGLSPFEDSLLSDFLMLHLIIAEAILESCLHVAR